MSDSTQRDESQAGSLKAMRHDWDARAEQDARHYINWPDVPNEEGAFFESGRADYERFVIPFFRRMGFDSRGKTALEIGCGIGRIARWMSEDFGQYIGVDISPEMVRRANEYSFPRATFRTVSGGDLGEIPNASVDFVFSLGVFQHINDKRAILNYLSETGRVLRPGGIFRLVLKGLWTRVLGSMALEAGLSRRFKVGGEMQVPFIRVRHLDTWQGRSIPPKEAIEECAKHGLDVQEIEGKWTVLMWIGGQKGKISTGGKSASVLGG